MKIGIDIDDTFTETKEIFSKYLKKYRKKNHIDIPIASKMSDEQYYDFLNQYGKSIYDLVKTKKYACKVIQKWIFEGNEIYFVTARSEKECVGVEEVTKNYLEKQGIRYSGIIFNSHNKYKDSKDIGLDVFIDDRESVLDAFPKDKMLLLRMLPNKMIYSKYQKVTNWKEISEIVDQIV